MEVLKRGFGMWWGEGEGEGLVEVGEGSLKQKESTLAMRQQVDQDPNPKIQRQIPLQTMLGAWVQAELNNTLS